MMDRPDDPTWRRWDEINRLFAAALDLPDAEREAFVSEACSDDRELHSAVLALLTADAESEGSFERPDRAIAEAALRDIATSMPAKPAPDRIGPYRLLRQIGRGGMGTVYLAERADADFEQRVAVKVLRRGLDTDDVVRRFVAERRILAGLDHPAIAQLFDGGSTEDGRPFLVMQYVEGMTITEYCKRASLPVRERLELFLEVCDAVRYAHTKLVVHRDLKPSNIMVTADGRVKLLDFGIAKLLTPGDDNDGRTRTGVHVLTPEYASPEQRRGEPITTASDVYQLGVLLYVLLTGHRPVDVMQTGAAGNAERPILAPSDTADIKPRLRSALRGDLDTITLKALREEPERRYDSARALIDDVRRYLDGHAVLARADTFGYRARKFVGRNGTSVVAGTAVAVLLVLYAVTTSFQSRRLAVERDRALAQEARAEKVTEFLVDIFQGADPNRTGGADVTALELLDEGASRALNELDGQPRTQADVLGTIGNTYIRLGLYERAVPFLERAVELGRQAGDHPADLVRDLRRLAAAHAGGRSTSGWYPDNQRAIELLDEAVAVAERELGPDDPRLAAALTALADNLGKVSDRREHASEAVERALVILRNQEADVREELASALHLSALGRRDPEAQSRLREALELRRSLYGEDHTAVAGTLNDLALVLEPLDPAAADTLLEQAAEINARIHGPDHAQTLTILGNLAGRYRDRGDYTRAEPLYREVLRRRRSAYPADSMGHAVQMHGLGWSLTELGRPDEAELILREAMQILVNSGHDRTSLLHHVASSTLGRALAAQQRYAEAEPLLRNSYAWAAEHAPHPNFIPFMLARLIDLYDAWDRPELAAGYRARLLQWKSRQTVVQGASADATAAASAATETGEGH
jgi:eukaryotic-like serine/threonine-protein kinase